jgi:hypothetical protein
VHPPAEHAVQFFDSHQTAATAIAEFVRQGVARSERMILIARPPDWTRAAVELSRDIDLSTLVESGTLTVLDSVRTLDALSRDGWPSADRFNQLIATMIDGAARGGPVRAYGDMVDVLAADGHFEAAARLEELWNDLRARIPFVLFCGYSSAHFCKDGHALTRIRELHSHERRVDSDVVASHLLDTVR